MKNRNIVIFGASGAIGSALTAHLSDIPSNRVIGFIRDQSTKPDSRENVTINHIDYSSESDLQRASTIAKEHGPLDLVIVAIGILHGDELSPEKSLRDLSQEKFEKYFYTNTVLPALIAKYFLPALRKDQRAVFAALSARVGSISDNRLGGWYGYRASKSALNMVIKNASIELARTNKHAVVVGLHPGTVASDLSAPFQKNVPDGKLSTAESAADKLISVVSQLDASHSGNVYAWDGSEVPS